LTLSELRELDLAEEAAAAEAAGVRFIWVPTPDRGTPELQRFRSLVAELIAELAGGHHVVVHCRMGIGRSSLVAAGVLVAQGMPAVDAWAKISDARGLAVPDTPEQRRWLETTRTFG
jgi:protein-tyrosine phosphatase